MTKLTLKEELQDVVVEFWGNMETSENIAKLATKDEETVAEILCDYKREWDAVECDIEGPTREQDRELDLIINDCVNEIIEL